MTQTDTTTNIAEITTEIDRMQDYSTTPVKLWVCTIDPGAPAAIVGTYTDEYGNWQEDTVSNDMSVEHAEQVLAFLGTLGYTVSTRS